MFCSAYCELQNYNNNIELCNKCVLIQLFESDNVDIAYSYALASLR